MFISKPTFVLVPEKFLSSLLDIFLQAKNKLHQSSPADQGVEIVIYNREFYDWCVLFGKAKKSHIACACWAYKVPGNRNAG